MITQSVDNIVVATDTAFIKALLVTRSGSIIPSLIISTTSPVITFNPLPFTLPNNSGKESWGHSIPALSKIALNGDSIAFNKTFSPSLSVLIFCPALRRAIPPPGTIPSFIAAFVAQIASSILSDFSFNSISEFAPTFTIAILADYLANLFSSLIKWAGLGLLANSSLTVFITSKTAWFGSPTCNIVSF